jgi:hypothetical protein
VSRKTFSKLLTLEMNDLPRSSWAAGGSTSRLGCMRARLDCNTVQIVLILYHTHFRRGKYLSERNICKATSTHVQSTGLRISIFHSFEFHATSCISAQSWSHLFDHLELWPGPFGALRRRNVSKNTVILFQSETELAFYSIPMLMN